MCFTKVVIKMRFPLRYKFPFMCITYVCQENISTNGHLGARMHGVCVCGGGGGCSSSFFSFGASKRLYYITMLFSV